MKICIPLNPNGGTFGNDTELRYMLRSLHTNWVGPMPEVIILGRKPAWITGVTHIPAVTLEDAQNAASQFSSFVWWYDDCFLLSPTKAENIKTPRYDGELDTGTWSEWQRELLRVKETLQKVGRTIRDFSKPHAPATYKGSDFSKALTYWIPKYAAYKFPIESWINNDGRPAQPAIDVRIHYTSTFTPPGPLARFLVVNGFGILSALDWMKATFPDPSRFEVECAEQPVTVTLSQGGGLGANMVRLASIADAWLDRTVYASWKGAHKYYALPDGVDAFRELFYAPEIKEEGLAQVADYPESVRRVSGDGLLYLHPHWPRARRELAAALSRMCTPRCEVYERVIALTGSSSPGDELVGAVYRVEPGIAKEQLSGKVTPISDFADCVENRAGTRGIMMCCNDSASMEYFKQRWGKRLLALPVSATNPQHQGQGVEHLKDTLAIMLALSTCDELVHGVSNMALVPLLMSPNMPHTFVQWASPILNTRHE
jgi:hypothetical protein